MQGDRQTYEHVVPEGMGLEAFCAREVETMGIEADGDDAQQQLQQEERLARRLG